MVFLTTSFSLSAKNGARKVEHGDADKTRPCVKVEHGDADGVRQIGTERAPRTRHLIQSVIGILAEMDN
jgi:hypothetical protein